LPAPSTTGVPRPAGSADGLAVVDWAGFKAAVSYTFDDANTSQIENYDALEALGVPFTFYLWTNMAGAMSEVWARAVTNGHEIGNHTQSHQMGDAPTIGEDTDAGEVFLESSLGVTVYTMAAPYGNTQYADVARTRYLINRGTVGGQVSPNDGSDPFNLPTFIPATGALASAFNTRIDTARTAGAWETVLVHGFVGGTDQAYQPVALSEFEAAVNYSKSFGDVWVGTILDVGAYWIAQKLISEATPTSDGTLTTWQWTLPEHFPPNRFVRVTVNGGTLQQNGLPIPWNEHGYYEVDLDSGSVTLAP
jgi:peptidoglycan/xylan/chitin deacetylase (PgdA/CDA1 family)